MVVCMPGFADRRVLAKREASIAVVVFSLQDSEGELSSVLTQNGLWKSVAMKTPISPDIAQVGDSLELLVLMNSLYTPTGMSASPRA